jgi:ribosome-associated translation inhibitor RaiA
MEIQINAPSTIERHEPLTTHIETVVKEALERFSQQTTRVVVHLSQGKDAKSPTGDHGCMMEARVQGHPPIVANDHAASLHQAIHGAAEKLKRAMDNTMGRTSAGARGGERIVDTLASDDTDPQT